MFLPALVGNADDRGLEHVRVRDKAVLQLNRGDPFTAGLDDVFGAVGQGDEALLVDAADVTGAQPAGIELGLVTSP